MCGKTGTAQVRKIAGSQRGQGGDWNYRDHGLFVFFAPFDNPRYAGAVVIEHGLGGARAAAPVAKDVLTYLFDQRKAMQRWPRSNSNGAERWPSGWRAAARPEVEAISKAEAAAAGDDLDPAIIPQPLARLPWRLIWLVALICTIGMITLYSAAGGRPVAHGRPSRASASSPSSAWRSRSATSPTTSSSRWPSRPMSRS